MLKRDSRPSFTSLVAFFVLVAPVVYVLSYAPVVRVCGRTVESRINLDLPIPQGSVGFQEAVIQQRLADSSLYPLYGPVDWLIDHTPLRGPLLWWANLWGVRDAFDLSDIERFLRDQRNAS